MADFDLHFASPRWLPKPGVVHGRVVVLDIAFAASAGGGVSFAATTKPFIDGLGERLVAWVDHHDHEKHAAYASDDRFILATKQEHGACPEMVTESLVARVGPVDSIVTHVDLDGLYAAAKWILRGKEPYPGADHDAWCVDTRKGEPSPPARLIDHALRAAFRDNDLKRAIIDWVVGGCDTKVATRAPIEKAAAAFRPLVAQAQALADNYTVRGHIAYVDTRQHRDFDKTELLLLGQKRAPVAVVHDRGMITIAAGFDSGWDFVSLLSLEGGMPTRVSIPERRLDEALAKIAAVR